MATVFDVAKYILEQRGEITAMKLQKLVYYSQAWHLVWDEEPLFPERIEAWANGPVVPDLYAEHKRFYTVDASSLTHGSSKNLTEGQVGSIDAVLSLYGDKKSQWLSELTHMEDPWKNARVGIPMGERGNREITHADMADYYSSLL